jgi:hypothetical protein
MAEVLKSHEWNHEGFRSKPLPEEWFDGQVRRLHRGVDFTVQLKSLQTRLNREARARGMHSRTRLNHDDGTVIMQALPGSSNGTDHDS